MTLAGGYKWFFVVADFNYSRADLGFDDNFTAKIGSVRAGWQGKVGGRGLQTWLGAGNWDTAATAKGHVDLEDGRRLTFEADQHPHTSGCTSSASTSCRQTLAAVRGLRRGFQRRIRSDPGSHLAFLNGLSGGACPSRRTAGPRHRW